MRLEIAERLRCPRGHAPTSLVLVAERTEGRELIDGLAGCPGCYAEVTIRAGDVRFSPTAPASAPIQREDGDDAASAARLQALLGLAEPGGAVLVTGRYAALAAPLAELVDVAVIAWNAAVDAGPGRSAVWLDEPVVPFSDATFRAAALDADTPLPVLLEALRACQPKARVVGRLPLQRPDLVRELARDDQEWVGELAGRLQPVVRIERR